MPYYRKRFPYDGHVDAMGNSFEVGEDNDGSTQTEQSGAASSEQQVRMMMQAGERLAAWREGYFDYRPGEEVDDDMVKMDRTRSSNYDLSDAHLDASYLAGKLTAAKQRREAEQVAASKAADAAKLADAALSTPPVGS